MEVLVAMVIVGLTVTVFFELLSGSLRLEHKVQGKLGQELVARAAFDKLLALDPRDPEFPWEGLAKGLAYEFSIFPLETQEDYENAADQGIVVRLPLELYGYELRLYEDEERTRSFRLVRYMAHPPGYYNEAFIEEWVRERPEGEFEILPDMFESMELSEEAS